MSDTTVGQTDGPETSQIYLRVIPMITVLATSEEEAAAKIDAMEQALIAVNPSVLTGDLFEEIWITTEDEKGEHERQWTRPEGAGRSPEMEADGHE